MFHAYLMLACSVSVVLKKYKCSTRWEFDVNLVYKRSHYYLLPLLFSAVLLSRTFYRIM
jgi:hypothetical protein